MLEKHVGKTAMQPKRDGPKPSLMASGRIDSCCVTGGRFPSGQQLEVVAGAGFEPATFGL